MNNPLLFVIFGISGDLAKRKLIPALYRLIEQEGMPKDFKIIGISRQPEYTADMLFDKVHDFIGSPLMPKITNSSGLFIAPLLDRSGHGRQIYCAGRQPL